MAKKLAEAVSRATTGKRWHQEDLPSYEKTLDCHSSETEAGLPTKEHARTGYDAWVGGIDLLKDDENLASQPCNKFKERVNNNSQDVLEEIKLLALDDAKKGFNGGNQPKRLARLRQSLAMGWLGANDVTQIRCRH